MRRLHDRSGSSDFTLTATRIGQLLMQLITDAPTTLDADDLSFGINGHANVSL